MRVPTSYRRRRRYAATAYAISIGIFVAVVLFLTVAMSTTRLPAEPFYAAIDDWIVRTRKAWH